MKNSNKQMHKSCMDDELNAIFHQFGDVVVNIRASNEGFVVNSSKTPDAVGSKTCQVFSSNFTNSGFLEQPAWALGCNGSVH